MNKGTGERKAANLDEDLSQVHAFLKLTETDLGGFVRSKDLHLAQSARNIRERMRVCLDIIADIRSYMDKGADGWIFRGEKRS